MRRVNSGRGCVLALFGPDGSGKTTAANELEKLCAQAGRATRRFHWRPRLLPSLSNPGDRGAPRYDVTGGPHDRKQRALLISIGMYFYFFLDFWLGYFFRLRPLVRQGTVVIYERYFYDLLLDPRRYRMCSCPILARLLASLVPKPDWIFILDADADVLISRKKELPRAEIVRQQKLMSAVLPNLADVVVIDVNKSDPVAVAGAIYQTFSGVKSK